MKEVNFRAWHKINERMHDVLSLQFTMKGQIFSMLLDNGKTPDVSNIELMQYTGLKDCKGKEIYEGDILRVENIYSDRLVAYVSWDKVIPLYSWMIGETWLLHFSHGEKGPLYPYCDRHNGYEVSIIGNIYENPKLLEATA